MSRRARGPAALLFAAALAAAPAWSQDLPQGPKLGPPSGLPEAPCDTARPDSGDWLLGTWGSGAARWQVSRGPAGLIWQRGEGGPLAQGRVAEVSSCSVVLHDTSGGVALEGVRSPSGAIYAHGPDSGGAAGRWVLRRQP